MSLELVRESTKINYVMGEDSAQTIVEHDIIVPDINPDVARILLLDGEVFERGSEASQDKVHVDGTVRYKILYISDDPEQAIKSINAASDFSYNIDVSNARSGMKTRVKCDIEHIDYEILNGRKINVKTILKLNAKAVSEMDQEFVNDLRGIDDLQVLKDNIDIYCYLGENTINYTIDEAMEIPAGKPSIKEILRSDIKIVGKDYRIAENKIIAKGDINILTLYIGDNEERSIQFMEHEVPFTQFIELPGIGDNSECEVDYKVSSHSFRPSEDSDGELRVLKGEVTVSLWAQATDRRKVEMISDAYSLSSRIGFEKQPFKATRIVCQDRSQITLKDIVTVGGDSPDIAEVFNVLCKPSLSECKAMNGSIRLEGVANNSVLYVANNTEQPVFSYCQEMPFTQNIEIDGIEPDMLCDVDLDIEHCNYSMISANEVEIRVVINVGIKVVEQIETALISKITEAPLEDKVLDMAPSITIYFSQPGDNLWKVAKKYYTTVDHIRKANNFDEDEKIEVGQQIIIPRKIS
ncbi:MAG: DUF3794 and LysM peptidoglycan-binding domain-containing protein [Bacillota bacterium]